MALGAAEIHVHDMRGVQSVMTDRTAEIEARLEMTREQEIDAWVASLPVDHAEDAMNRHSVKKSRRAKLKAIIDEALAAQREADARIADAAEKRLLHNGQPTFPSLTARDIAAAIRSAKEPGNDR